MGDPYFDKYYVILKGDEKVAQYKTSTHYVEFPHANMVIVYAKGGPAKRLELALTKGEWTSVVVMDAI